MEQAGIRVEKETLKAYGDKLKIKSTQLEQQIYEEAGETFNINSPNSWGDFI